MKKKRIGILFGGQSAEHEVSLQSAKSVIEAINKDKYELVLMGIERDGTWYLIDMAHFLRNADDPKSISLEHGNKRLALVPGSTGPHFILADSGKAIASPDVMFPVLHGPFGEDGTVQGFLQLADLPFVGAGVRGSAIGMDKEIMKRLLEQAGIAQANFRSYHYRDKASISYDKMNSELGMPCFVKPANLGSSVGITKAHDQNAFDQAVEKAFRYDEKIVIEEYIRGREIECSVLGNETPVASLPGEIKPSHEYYSYQAKYLDSNGAQFAIPAAVSPEMIRKIQDTAVATFKALDCAGLARVDFFLTENDDLLVNELNSIPGFTKISMYPKMWEASGISFSDLIDRLIDLAIEKHGFDKSRHSEQID